MTSIRYSILKILLVSVLGVSPLFASWMQEDRGECSQIANSKVFLEDQQRYKLCAELSYQLLKAEREEKGLPVFGTPSSAFLWEVKDFANILFKLDFTKEELQKALLEATQKPFTAAKL